MTSESHSCCEKPPVKWKWYKDKLLVTFLALVVILILGLFIPFLKKFDMAFWNYTKMIWWAVALGIILGGVIDYYVPQIYISKYLARKSKRTIFYSVGLGFLMSACSHGILALSMELHKKGAGGPSVVSFLLASPWTNLPVTLLLIGFFGVRGVLIIFSALVVALITGFVFQFLERKGMIEENVHSLSVDSKFSILEDIKRRWKVYHFSLRALKDDIQGVCLGIWELSEMVLWWILMGFFLASVIAAYVPPQLFHRFLGPGLSGLLVTLGLAVVLEVCSEGTAPLAFEIYRQTGVIGNSLVFLMAGVATDYTEVGLIWTNIGPRTALWMVGVCIPQILFLGWMFNHFF